jgi:hypothetical protein
LIKLNGVPGIAKPLNAIVLPSGMSATASLKLLRSLVFCVIAAPPFCVVTMNVQVTCSVKGSACGDTVDAHAPVTVLPQDFEQRRGA